ncbi:hypothetical protein GGR57DRAFT_490048 [Xylariaceae sp. FL1272]|nr:hypothetical protein GGR57DRAFT_490048 [Xylariaceae sp. FL1272]
MEPLRLKPRKPVEDVVENWDDDDFIIENDEDLTFRSHSSTTTTTAAATATTTNPANPSTTINNFQRRSSRSSFRSDRESIPGEERQVHLPGDDEKSTLGAIAAAVNAGIPIPNNVPPSALVGGSIKRLGGRKTKKVVQEDWDDDLELPTAGQTLRLKRKDGIIFPDALRQVSNSTNPSPAKKSAPTISTAIPAVTQMLPPRTTQPKALGAPINLARFQDTDDDDDIFADPAATIKPSKLQVVKSRPISLITPPTPSPPKRSSEAVIDDDFEADLELPSDGKLKLSSRRDIPKTPSLQTSDDFDWGEGSLGTRFGGTKRDAFSNPGSSVSALSPSIASSITAESEDELFDGIVLPFGPLDFSERLKTRKKSRSPERPAQESHQQDNHSRSPKIALPQDKRSPSPKTTHPLGQPTRFSPPTVSTKRRSPQHVSAHQGPRGGKDEEDFVSGLDFGDGNVFRFAKPTAHRNIKVKEARAASPTRPKTAVTITFTNKPVTSTNSRLPRPLGGHERSHTQSSLEPVPETGGPLQQIPLRRPQSRLSGHSAHSSISSVHTPTTPSSAQPNFPSTPRRRELGQKASTGALRNEPTTTSAQLLRLKRSLPVMRNPQSPAKLPTARSDRPTSRGESRADVQRTQSSLRPKTPVDRARPTAESNAAQVRKGQAPFLPAGASQSQSHHVTARASRVFRRHDSDQAAEARPLSRALSRNALRSPSPRRLKHEKSLGEPTWQQLSKPRRVRPFGDGHELDAFDDLPTSAQTESRFTKNPTGNRVNIRNKNHQNVLPERNTPSPVSPYSPARTDSQPHFARDTAASRMAREASLAQRAQPTGTLANVTAQRAPRLLARSNLNPHLSHGNSRSKKSKQPVQLKPHLISNLNPAKETKVVNGMTYNPTTFRWEGNENDYRLNGFDVPASSPATTPLTQTAMRERDNSTPRPLLITNINARKDAKRVGDMVFDPQNMCWLKVDTSTPTSDSRDNPMAGFDAMEDEDPFKNIPDLEDKVSTAGRVSDIRDDWLVGEEFDVGPEFIRRQREEETRWQRKCGKWIGKSTRSQADLRWDLHMMVVPLKR